MDGVITYTQLYAAQCVSMETAHSLAGVIALKGGKEGHVMKVKATGMMKYIMHLVSKMYNVLSMDACSYL